MPFSRAEKRNSPVAKSVAVGFAKVSEFEMPCIRCGDCATVCPAQLQPQQLLWDIRAERLSEAADHGLLDCSECGRCDVVCPSRIKLVQGFRAAKLAIAAADEKMQVANAARERLEIRNVRLQRESVERAEREAALAQKATSTDAVAAAIERAKARRQQPKDKS